MGTIDYEILLKCIQSRWPRELNASDTETAKAMLLDLIARSWNGSKESGTPTSPTRKRSAKTARRLAIDTTTEGERLARYEMECDRRFMKPGPRSGNTGGKWSGREEEDDDQAEYDVVRAEERAVLEYLSATENKNGRPKPIRFRRRWKLKPIKGFWSPEKHLSSLIPGRFGG